MFLTILAASLIGSICALIGGLFLLWKENTARRLSLTLISFAAGSLIGAAFLELIPEALELIEYESLAFYFIGGILAIFLFEKILSDYHCHHHGICDHPQTTLPSAVLLGDSIHNFIDGITIALSFFAGIPAGIATTVAVFFHEVPQEIGDFGVLLHAGYAKRRIFWLNFWTALTTSFGAIIGYFLAGTIEPVIPYFLAFAAGSFIYIAVSDLLPELRHKAKSGDIGHVLVLLAGIGVIYLVGLLFHE